eukprot:6180463-Pleurochrysis_carterae.AAC.1
MAAVSGRSSARARERTMDTTRLTTRCTPETLFTQLRCGTGTAGRPSTALRCAPRRPGRTSARSAPRHAAARG